MSIVMGRDSVLSETLTEKVISYPLLPESIEDLNVNISITSGSSDITFWKIRSIVALDLTLPNICWKYGIPVLVFKNHSPRNV